MKLRPKSKPAKRHASQLNRPVQQKKSPFIEHIHELRKRLFYIAVSVVGFSSLAFSQQNYIVGWLRKPAGGQILTTTTPGGAFNFLFQIAITTGVIASIPVIVYQLLRYVQPLIKQGFMRVMAWSSIASGVLAIIGVLFGYYCGLPSSLSFLFGQSANLHLVALITIDSYTSFVTMYLLGAAMLFQVPLIIIVINRIKPLKPMQLLKFERPFIVVSAVLGAIVSPSPNVGDMMTLTIPMVTMYQFSMIAIWIINRRNRRPKKVVALLHKDAEQQAARLAKFKDAQNLWQQALQSARTAPEITSTYASTPVPIAKAVVEPQMPHIRRPLAVAPIQAGITHTRSTHRQRPTHRTYFNDFVQRKSYTTTQLSSNEPATE